MATRSEAETGNQKHLIHGFYSTAAGLTEAESQYIENFITVACSGGLPQDLPLLHLTAGQLTRLLKITRWLNEHPEELNPPFTEKLISLENALARNLDRLYMTPMSRGQAGISTIKHPEDLMLKDVSKEDNNDNKG
jgi:hypothetical protein